MQIPKDHKRDNDYKYTIIPHREYSRTVSDDGEVHTVLINSTYLFEIVASNVGSNSYPDEEVTLWRVDERFTTFQKNYEYYENQLRYDINADGEKIEKGRDNDEGIMFSRDHIFLIHKRKSKISLCSYILSCIFIFT